MPNENNYERKSDQLIEELIKRFDSLEKKVEDHITTEQERMETTLSQLDELIKAWNQAKGIVWFVKVVASIVGTVGLAWAFLHNHFSIGIK